MSDRSEVSPLRGDFLRIEDLVGALEIGRAQIDRACRQFRVTRGREGLPHCKLGRGFLFRRDAVLSWVQKIEESQHG